MEPHPDVPTAPGAREAADALRARVEASSWYHTMELPGGVVTPGRWDTRGALRHIDFPGSLSGRRCLDVGTWDGFWAYEMERRGAREVVAIDLDDVTEWDWPASATQLKRERFQAVKSDAAPFWIAHEALGSRVERRACSVYELAPETVGMFDFAFIGSLLLHLRDPVRALQALRSVVTGSIIAADQISISLSVLQPTSAAAHLAARDEPHWWTPNAAALRRLVEAAGFHVVRRGRPYFLRPGPGAPRTLRARLRVAGVFGAPHTWVAARP
ncbi:MAG TPA: methyltransferase domain-containing protein [Candidatus Dormibacteraeota bacterium]|nr:methyltransferase domain-containing protein [Candidatus Dormibacteraeota bacterium]